MTMIRSGLYGCVCLLFCGFFASAQAGYLPVAAVTTPETVENIDDSGFSLLPKSMWLSTKYADKAWVTSGDVYDKYEWGVMGYVGAMTGSELYHDMYFDFNGLGPGTLYSFEVLRQLPKDNWARQLFRGLVSTIEVGGNYTYETDPTGPINEGNAYFVFRWRDFPWNHKVLTTFGIGEGLSYASHVPQQELDSEDEPGNATRLLNYLMTELTFSMPEHPEWQVMYRLHHRSGVFGLYTPGTVGSTAAGIGVRYWME